MVGSLVSVVSLILVVSLISLESLILVKSLNMEYKEDKRILLGTLQRTFSISGLASELVDIIYNCHYNYVGYPLEKARDFDVELTEIEAAP